MIIIGLSKVAGTNQQYKKERMDSAIQRDVRQPRLQRPLSELLRRGNVESTCTRYVSDFLLDLERKRKFLQTLSAEVCYNFAQSSRAIGQFRVVETR